MNKHLLVTWHESGDEIHFVIMDIIHHDFIKGCIDEAFKNKKGFKCGYDYNIIDKATSFIFESERDEITGHFDFPNIIEHYHIQTYCDEQWPLSKYNIERVIYLPELGC